MSKADNHDFIMRVQLAEDAVAKSRLSLEAAKLDSIKQKKRVTELRKEVEAVALLQARSEYGREAIRHLRTIEDEPNISFLRKADRVRHLLGPIAEWNHHAQSLIDLIDLEMRDMTS